VNKLAYDRQGDELSVLDPNVEWLGRHFIWYRFPTGTALFSVPEYSAVTSHMHALASQWLSPGQGEYAVAYGTYLAQEGIEVAQARVDALKCRGLGLGYLLGPKVEVLELVDIELYAAQKGRPGLPFAALVRIDGAAVEVLRSQSAIIAAFLRYRNLDAAQNIANRPGVFAMRALGESLEHATVARAGEAGVEGAGNTVPGTRARRAWRSTVDRVQVVRAARGVVGA
jgi:hypothetical protein